MRLNFIETNVYRKTHIYNNLPEKKHLYQQTHILTNKIYSKCTLEYPFKVSVCKQNFSKSDPFLSVLLIKEYQFIK